MAVKFYQAPVTEVYAVRAQVIMDGTGGVQGGGSGAPGEIWD